MESNPVRRARVCLSAPRRWLVAAVLVSLLVTAWAAQGAAQSQEPQMPPGHVRDLPATALAQPSSAPEKTVYVDATIGRDIAQCGTQQMPCRTINYGLHRAQQIQGNITGANQPGSTYDPGVADWATVQVGPGTYTENVLIRSRFISLRGASRAATIITTGSVAPVPGLPAVQVQANPVSIGGFTFQGSRTGVDVSAGAQVAIFDCDFVGNRWGMQVRGARAGVSSSTFSGNLYGVYALDATVLSLTDVSITGQGQNTTGMGVRVRASQAWIFRSAASSSQPTITNHLYGVLAEVSVVDIHGYQISQNTYGVASYAGVTWVGFGDSVTNNSQWGIFATRNAYFEIEGNATISGNGGDAHQGIRLEDFSRCIIHGENTITDSISPDDSSDYRLRTPPGP